ncbi:MAG: hypothetical protein M5U09_03070 [Gammaproteobacteria bacterium]|nr:hypothetical protein [Gammaproteobacteria bacterium]
MRSTRSPRAVSVLDIGAHGRHQFVLVGIERAANPVDVVEPPPVVVLAVVVDADQQLAVAPEEFVIASDLETPAPEGAVKGHRAAVAKREGVAEVAVGAVDARLDRGGVADAGFVQQAGARLLEDLAGAELHVQRPGGGTVGGDFLRRQRAGVVGKRLVGVVGGQEQSRDVGKGELETPVELAVLAFAVVAVAVERGIGNVDEVVESPRLAARLDLEFLVVVAPCCRSQLGEWHGRPALALDDDGAAGRITVQRRRGTADDADLARRAEVDAVHRSWPSGRVSGMPSTMILIPRIPKLARAPKPRIDALRSWAKL